jgi:PDZ domain/Aspartyl protease
MHRRDAMRALLAAAALPTSAQARGIALRNGAKAANLGFRLIDNRLFVAVHLDGRGPYQFVFDSGGSNIIDEPLARELGLPLRDGFSMPGAGESTLPAWRSQVREARLGAVEMRDAHFVVMPLGEIRQAIGFERLDGLVGHELLQRFVVGIDFAATQLRFDEPAAAPPAREGLQRLEIDFTGAVPRLRGQVDGRAATLAIDTGDRSSLTLFTPFVDDHSLRAAYPAQVRHLTGWGVGGPLMADVTRVGRLRLGEVELRDVVTRMPLARGGVFASRLASGSIGTGVLKRLDLRFDYARRQLHLAPRARAAANAAEADSIDRSGLWLARRDADGGAFEVLHVVDGGPAQRAGLTKGDRVTAVDGRPARELHLPELRDRLAREAPGQAVTLGLRDGRESRVVLADLM